MSKTVFDVIIENIEARAASYEQAVTSGSPKDWPEYRELCGLIRGLEIALREVKDLSRHYMEQDND